MSAVAEVQVHGVTDPSGTCSGSMFPCKLFLKNWFSPWYHKYLTYYRLFPPYFLVPTSRSWLGDIDVDVCHQHRNFGGCLCEATAHWRLERRTLIHIGNWCWLLGYWMGWICTRSSLRSILYSQSMPKQSLIACLWARSISRTRTSAATLFKLKTVRME